MKKMINMLMLGFVVIAMTMGQAAPNGCDGTPTGGSRIDATRQMQMANNLQSRQATPTDVKFSLERFNLIRRTYWVNGMREKAIALTCPVERPIGYIVLLTKSGTVLANFIVDGKLSSLRSYLTPESEYNEITTGSTQTLYNHWLADVDGCYGDNSEGVFFFTPDGKYIEWTGEYLYSDIPFTIKDPVLQIQTWAKGAK